MRKKMQEPPLDSVEARIRDLAIEQLSGIKDDTDVTLDADLMGDLGADSLDMVELVMSVEEAFDLEIPHEKAYQFKTIGELCRLVEEQKVKETV